MRWLVILVAAAGLLSGCQTGPHEVVPREYRPMIKKAERHCDAVDRQLLAAQIDQESGWQEDVTSGSGAQGLAQFIPETWQRWGTDVDGNGRASPYDPADAIDAQARLMCHFVELAENSGIDQDPVKLALAGYNAGWSNVEKYQGVPPFPETRGYVQKILDNAPRYRFSGD